MLAKLSPVCTWMSKVTRNKTGAGNHNRTHIHQEKGVRNGSVSQGILAEIMRKCSGVLSAGPKAISQQMQTEKLLQQGKRAVREKKKKKRDDKSHIFMET